MKTHLFPAALLLALTVQGQTTDPATNADSLVRQSVPFYQTDPQKFIRMQDSAALLFEKAGNRIWQALSYQNIAFVYEEKLNNIDSAICHVQLAIPIWTGLHENKGLANILKYQGMLYGKQGRFGEAKKNISQAIELFRKEGLETGVAVAYYDLGLVYENEHKTDSCIYYINKNRAYFSQVADTFRVFNANNKLFEIYLNEKNYGPAASCYEENTRLEPSPAVFWQHLLDFYQRCIRYFEAIGNAEKVKIYKDKYDAYHKQLKAQGFINE